MGQDRSPDTLEAWFRAGCYQSAFVYGMEQSSNDADLAEVVAIEACNTPFRIASDLGVETAILPTGVCFHLDFEPSREQMASGLVPCPSDVQ